MPPHALGGKARRTRTAAPCAAERRLAPAVGCWTTVAHEDDGRPRRFDQVTDAPLPVPRTLADLLPRTTDATRSRVRDAALVVGFAVLTAVLAQVRIGLSFTPVPVTGQTLGVLLAGATLGAGRGAASMGLYWIAGIFMPVAWYASDDSGRSIDAGWNIATGVTAGYLFGFVLAAAAVGYLA